MNTSETLRDNPSIICMSVHVLSSDLHRSIVGAGEAFVSTALHDLEFVGSLFGCCHPVRGCSKTTGPEARSVPTSWECLTSH